MRRKPTDKDIFISVDCPSEKGGCGVFKGNKCVTLDDGKETEGFHATRRKEAERQGLWPRRVHGQLVHEDALQEAHDKVMRRRDVVEIATLANQLQFTFQIMRGSPQFFTSIAETLLELGFKPPKG